MFFHFQQIQMYHSKPADATHSEKCFILPHTLYQQNLSTEL
jgi:hypothetical protein